MLAGLYLRHFDRQADSGDDAGRIQSGSPIFRRQAVSHGVYTIDHRSQGSGGCGYCAADL